MDVLVVGIFGGKVWLGARNKLCEVTGNFLAWGKRKIRAAPAPNQKPRHAVSPNPSRNGSPQHFHPQSSE